ncbi:hypothetical protein KAFR_0D01250 [Kazachstania africana CBS 2517]|uniref:Endonuclease/exonuclease/phosphatase domain-containing protein n=1 Tax=Kazachstania africana (strain ATCC 22294 / BCRC 22015 / CBS 2517 / CECT 1963 / NBRC 1671 / NRRL Y-8276) TaxID=1071382 RepID=H2ATS1_KAZAF|nr:hypothetical protein KAFR_0D01250 [Kazachstania africana CBS 2517]CCF57771.1 hypothetical protein KAFR_0D01250 [Kazachstania africana CBS 2517]
MFQRKLINVNNTISNSTNLSSFTLLTYNILSQSYMWPQVYKYVPAKYKSWEYRHKLLEYEILKLYNADIICLQELTSRDYEYYWRKKLSKFNKGSDFICKTPPKYWTKAADDLDGVGIFYNLDMFELIDSNGIRLSDFLISDFEQPELDYLASRKLVLTDGEGRQIKVSNILDVLEEKNQVCLFMTLKHKRTGATVVVVTTHLYWKYDEIKLTQCMIIMRQLSKIMKDQLKKDGSSFVKVLFAGDLNSNRNSVVINFLKGQILNNNKLNMLNPMRAYLNRTIYDDIPNSTYLNTCYSGKLKGVFDYIWYHDAEFRMTKILSGKEVSQELLELEQHGLPNADHPSDHIPVLAEFQIL